MVAVVRYSSATVQINIYTLCIIRYSSATVPLPAGLLYLPGYPGTVVLPYSIIRTVRTVALATVVIRVGKEGQPRRGPPAFIAQGRYLLCVLYLIIIIVCGGHSQPPFRPALSPRTTVIHTHTKSLRGREGSLPPHLRLRLHMEDLWF